MKSSSLLIENISAVTNVGRQDTKMFAFPSSDAIKDCARLYIRWLLRFTKGAYVKMENYVRNNSSMHSVSDSGHGTAATCF